MTHRIRMVVLSLGALLTIMGILGPWLKIGPLSWSSPDLRGVVVDLGFSLNGVFDLAVRLWILIPILVVLSVVAGWMRRPIASSVLGLLGGSYAAIVALVVTQAPNIKLFSIEWGVYLTFVGSVVVLITSIWGMLSRSQEG